MQYATLHVPAQSVKLYRIWEFGSIVPFSDDECPPLRGDLNNDGKVDINDVVEIINIMAGQTE